MLENQLRDFSTICAADEVVLFERATFLVISHTSTLDSDQYDSHRFERISNIIKQFKISCSKSQSQFQGYFYCYFILFLLSLFTILFVLFYYFFILLLFFFIFIFIIVIIITIIIITIIERYGSKQFSIYCFHRYVYRKHLYYGYYG